MARVIERQTGLVFAAGVDFDGYMNELFVDFQGGTVFVWGFRMMSDDADDGGEFSGADLPDVQVGYFGVAVGFNAFADDHGQVRTGRDAIHEN